MMHLMPNRVAQIPLIVDMASQCRREVIQTNCMVALVSITCTNGQEVGPTSMNENNRSVHVGVDSNNGDA